MSSIGLIKHEAVPKCGSYEVRFSDGGRPGISIGTTFRGAGSGLNYLPEKAVEQKAKGLAQADRG